MAPRATPKTVKDTLTPDPSPFDAPPPGKQEPKRDRWGRYLLPHPDATVLGLMPWTRATTFAKSISDTYRLDLWQRRTVATGLVARRDLLARVSAVLARPEQGNDERHELDKLLEEAKEAAAAKAGANLGTALHDFTESVDHGSWPEHVPEFLEADLYAYRAMCAEFGLGFPRQWIERITAAPQWMTAGTMDRICVLSKALRFTVNGVDHLVPAGTHLIFDLKSTKTDSIVYAWNEISIQLTVYSRGAGLWLFGPGANGGRWETMPQVNQRWGLVGHVPATEGVATLYVVDLEAGAAGADLCHEVRQWRKDRVAAIPLSRSEAPVVEVLGFEDLPPTYGDALEAVEAGKLSDSDILSAGEAARLLSWEERIAAAASVGELGLVWRDCRDAGETTMQLRELAAARREALDTA